MKTHVCKLKQAPRTWYGRIDSFMMSLGFTKSKVYPNLYLNIENDGPITLFLYVDDVFLTDEENIITYCHKNIATEFEMKDLGPIHYFLGLEVWQSP
jgi:hypothetical protein